jgi:biotin operon repressor
VQHQRRLSGGEISELVHNRQSGMAIQALTEAFGVHRTTVMAHIARVRSEGDSIDRAEP